ncbi:MAG: hypothetical protein AMXMBFR22_12760 [Phycisphaerae bacterium]
MSRLAGVADPHVSRKMTEASFPRWDDPSAVAPKDHPGFIAPEGAPENSPARQGWETVADEPGVPEGRQKFKGSGGRRAADLPFHLGLSARRPTTQPLRPPARPHRHDGVAPPPVASTFHSNGTSSEVVSHIATFSGIPTRK